MWSQVLSSMHTHASMRLAPVGAPSLISSKEIAPLWIINFSCFLSPSFPRCFPSPSIFKTHRERKGPDGRTKFEARTAGKQLFDLERASPLELKSRVFRGKIVTKAGAARSDFAKGETKTEKLIFGNM